MIFLTLKQKKEKNLGKKIAYNLKIYPSELKICQPKLITQWNWKKLKTEIFIIHRIKEDKIEIRRLD